MCEDKTVDLIVQTMSDFIKKNKGEIRQVNTLSYRKLGITCKVVLESILQTSATYLQYYFSHIMWKNHQQSKAERE